MSETIAAREISEKALGEIQDMLTAKLDDARHELRSCEGGLFWTREEEPKRLARIYVLKEIETELVRMLEDSYK